MTWPWTQVYPKTRLAKSGFWSPGSEWGGHRRGGRPRRALGGGPLGGGPLGGGPFRGGALRGGALGGGALRGGALRGGALRGGALGRRRPLGCGFATCGLACHGWRGAPARRGGAPARRGGALARYRCCPLAGRRTLAGACDRALSRRRAPS